MRLKRLSQAVMLSTLAAANADIYASDEFVIDEIVVTAQKKAESAQDVAISMSVQTAEALDNIAAFNFEDVSKLSPGLEFAGKDPVGGSIKMRGVGRDPFSGSMDDSVVVFIDGVAQSSVGAAFGSLSDIERVEVLRGPQGTLYGKNAPAGAINVTTKAVNMNEFEGGVQTSHGYYDETGTYSTNNKFHVNIPLIDDRLGLRLSGFYDDSEGYLDNAFLDKPADDANRQGGRFKLQYRPTDTVDVTLIGNYSDNYQGRAFGYIPGFGPDYVAIRDAQAQGTPATTDTFSSVFGGDIPGPDQNAYKVYADINAFSRTRLRDTQLKLDWDLGSHTLASLTYYQDVNTEYVEDQRGTPIVDAALEIQTKQSIFSQEIRLSNNDADKLDYLTGLYYAKSESSGPGGMSTLNTRYGASFVNGMVRADSSTLVSGIGGTETFGLFTHGSYHFSDEWHLDVGVRYSDERKFIDQSLLLVNEDCTNTLPFFNACGFVPASLALPGYESTNDNYYNVSGSVKLRYMPDNNTMYYAALDSAYRSGGFNGSTPAPADQFNTFEAEDSYAFEVGMKANFFDNTLQLNVAYYYQIFKNYQFGDTIRQDNNTTDFIGQPIFTDLDPSAGVNAVTMGTSHVLNADEALSTGVEMDFVWLLSQNVDISGGLTYIETEYKEFMGFCDEGEGASTQQMFCDFSGERIGSNFGIAPARWVANIQPGYHTTLDDWGVEFFARAQINYDDVRHTNADLHFGLTELKDVWELKFYVKNLLDRGPGEVFQRALAGSTDTFSYDMVAPRQLGVTLGYRF